METKKEDDVVDLFEDEYEIKEKPTFGRKFKKLVTEKGPAFMAGVGIAALTAVGIALKMGSDTTKEQNFLEDSFENNCLIELEEKEDENEEE